MKEAPSSGSPATRAKVSRNARGSRNSLRAMPLGASDRRRGASDVPMFARKHHSERGVSQMLTREHGAHGRFGPMFGRKHRPRRRSGRMFARQHASCGRARPMLALRHGSKRGEWRMSARRPEPLGRARRMSGREPGSGGRFAPMFARGHRARPRLRGLSRCVLEQRRSCEADVRAGTSRFTPFGREVKP